MELRTVPKERIEEWNREREKEHKMIHDWTPDEIASLQINSLILGGIIGAITTLILLMITF